MAGKDCTHALPRDQHAQSLPGCYPLNTQSCETDPGQQPDTAHKDAAAGSHRVIHKWPAHTRQAAKTETKLIYCIKSASDPYHTRSSQGITSASPPYHRNIHTKGTSRPQEEIDCAGCVLSSKAAAGPTSSTHFLCQHTLPPLCCWQLCAQ